MVIIKMAILYFIQITHTDDFPSTGTVPGWCKIMYVDEVASFLK